MPKNERQKVNFLTAPNLPNGMTSAGGISSGANADLPIKTGATAATQLNVNHVTSAVNYVEVSGSTGTSPVDIAAKGTSTNLNITLTAKGTGTIVDATGNGLVSAGGLATGADSDLPLKTGVTAATQFNINHVASAVNYLEASGSTGTATVVLAGVGTGADVPITLTPKGAGQLIASTPVRLPSYTTAGAPDATIAAGALIYATDGDTGSPCLAVSNGTNWLRVALGAAIAAS